MTIHSSASKLSTQSRRLNTLLNFKKKKKKLLYKCFIVHTSRSYNVYSIYMGPVDTGFVVVMDFCFSFWQSFAKSKLPMELAIYRHLLFPLKNLFQANQQISLDLLQNESVQA